MCGDVVFSDPSPLPMYETYIKISVVKNSKTTISLNQKTIDKSCVF